MYIEIFCDFSFLFFKQKTAYEMRISDWSSDVCSSDLLHRRADEADQRVGLGKVAPQLVRVGRHVLRQQAEGIARREHGLEQRTGLLAAANSGEGVNIPEGADVEGHFGRPEIVRLRVAMQEPAMRSEEHTSELQSL